MLLILAGQVLQTNTDCLINMVNNSGQLNATTQEMSENWEVKLHQSLVIQLFSTMKYGVQYLPVQAEF